MLSKRYESTEVDRRSFRHFWALLLHVLNDFVWLRITDEGSEPEMPIWSTLLLNLI